MAANDAFRPDIPSTARMYDYYLGGKDNYPADREAAEKAIAALPEGGIRNAILENRRFLGRAVRFLAGEAKIRQFLDIGTGLPAMNQVHEITRDIDPGCRVVYVDHDPVVLAHARDMLNGVPSTTIIQHDLREPEKILEDPELRSLIDFGEPVALLLVAILHFITDEDDPLRLVRALLDPLPSGSYLAISHATSDGDKRVDDAAGVYSEARATSSAHMRSRDQVAAFFDGLEFVEPGLVWLPQWRPDAQTGLRDRPTDSIFWCGVARKPLIRAAGRDLHYLDPGSGEYHVECPGELPGPVPDHEPEPASALPQVHQQVPGLLDGSPGQLPIPRFGTPQADAEVVEGRWHGR